MFERILTGVAIVGAGIAVTALSMTWVVVSVAVEQDDLHLWIPAPVILAQGAATLIDPPELHEEIPVDPQHLEIAAAVLRELENVGDAELVRVESGDETVVIRKEGEIVRIEVNDGSQHVRVNAPIRQVREFLEDCRDEPLEPSRIFRLARSLPSGPLVEVSEPGTRVSVRVW
jgi:hypothetical protein